MNLSLGIVGLPNVGKSTLFNALTKQQVLAENYPFATIDPNHGVVHVHDERLHKIAEVQKPGKVVPAIIEFVDIAGLVKGASTGEGLGNKFLANIRETSAIIHVVRSFKNDNITHVENSVDPLRDIELIDTELILKDIESVQARIKTLVGKAKSDPKTKVMLDYFEGLSKHLEDGKLAYDYKHSEDDETEIIRKEIFLLTDKPVMYLVNSTEDEFENDVKQIRDFVHNKEAVIVPMDFKLESDLATMEDDERKEFMVELGIEKTGLDTLTSEAYKLLGLMSFFTSGPMETRAWTIRTNTSAPGAAGEIHTDIQKGFISAEIVNWEDFVELGGWTAAKEKGKVRLEGKTYTMQEGDIVLFKHNI